MIHPRSRRAGAAALALLALAPLALAHPAAAAPPRASDPVPDPGKGTANTDDTSAIALNPAGLAFLPGPEFRWNLLWTGSASTLPDRGTSFAVGVPIGWFATGLRLDLLSPPGAAPAPFDQTYHWLRWALAFGSEEASIGTTFGWGF